MGSDEPRPDDRERLVLELGQSLHRYGTPAHRIELTLGRVSEVLGLTGQFFALPTSITASFGPLGAQRTGMVRLDPGEVDLGKIAELDEEVKGLIARPDQIAETVARVQRIAAEPPLYPPSVAAIAMGAASGAGACFFGGGWIEMAVSTTIGLLIGLLEPIARRMKGGLLLYAPFAAALSAALANAGQSLLGSYRVDVVIMAGLLYLLPGLTLTIALTELSTRNLVAGTARLTAALLILLELGFGVAVGSRVSMLIAIDAATVGAPLPGWTLLTAVVLAAVCLVVLLRARWRDAPVIIVACLLAFGASRFGSLWLDPPLGACLGAAVVGTVCNAYGRLADRPPTVPFVPALILLVPGSIGMRSVTWLLRDETIPAVDAAFEMALVATSLAVGTLFANLVLPPARDL